MAVTEPAPRGLPASDAERAARWSALFAAQRAQLDAQRAEITRLRGELAILAEDRHRAAKQTEAT